jgi:hypothetical protein
MKRVLLSMLAVAATAPALAADVGVSVTISEPGVFGRVDIGRFPQPQVIVPQPVIIAPPRVVAGPPVQPVYMWVPYGHRKDWAHHCKHYNACGVPVYFVRHDWYDREVRRPYDRDRHDGDRHGGDHGRGHGKGKGRD